MAKKIAMRFFVSGKVQGVWFRASTKEQADILGITGYARNLPDGRVEVLAYGFNDAVSQLQQWLKRGPDRAEVVDIFCEVLEWRAYQGFQVL